MYKSAGGLLLVFELESRTAAVEAFYILTSSDGLVENDGAVPGFP